MGDVLKLQAMIIRGERDEKIQDQVGTIYEGIRMANGITRQSGSLALQDKEGMDKIKYRALSYRHFIKDDLQTTMAIVKNINQYQTRPMESLKKQLEGIRARMLNITSLEQWSEDIDSSITPVLLLLDKTMKDIRGWLFT